MIPFFQAPAIRIVLPDKMFERELRSNEKWHYWVVSDWDGTAGKAHYEYQMEWQVEKTAQKKVIFTVVAKLSNLTAVYDGVPTHEKLFGVIPTLMSASGPPKNMSGGGTIATYSIPLLAFTLPDSNPSLMPSFPLTPFAVDRLGSVYGSGRIEGFQNHRMGILFQLTVGQGDAAPTIAIHSKFRMGSGALDSAEGVYKDPSGTLTFKIRRD